MLVATVTPTKLGNLNGLDKLVKIQRQFSMIPSLNFCLKFCSRIFYTSSKKPKQKSHVNSEVVGSSPVLIRLFLVLIERKTKQ